MGRIRWRHPEASQPDETPPAASQAPQEWRYEVVLRAASDPGQEVDRALRVWFGDIVKDVKPC